MDAQTLTLISVLLAAVVVVPTFGSWFEARRQGRLEKVRPIVPPDPSLSVTQQKTVWRCGVYDYPPLSTILSRRPFVAEGPLIDLARQVLAALGREPDFFEFTYRDFYAGRPPPELVLGMFRTDQRTKVMRFSRPIYQIGLQGICRLDLDGDLHDQMRNGDLKIAVYDGEVGWEYVDENLKNLPDDNVIRVSGGRQLETMEYLKSGTYDIVIMDELSCINFLKEGDNSKEFKLAFKRSLDEYKASFAVNSDLEALLPEINDAIENARNDPAFQESEAIVLRDYDLIVRKGLTARK